MKNLHEIEPEKKKELWYMDLPALNPIFDNFTRSVAGAGTAFTGFANSINTFNNLYTNNFDTTWYPASGTYIPIDATSFGDMTRTYTINFDAPLADGQTFSMEYEYDES